MALAALNPSPKPWIAEIATELQPAERQHGGGETTSISHSANLAMRERAIRWASDIHAEGARRTMRAFVISADGAPFTVRRVPYTNWHDQGVFDSPEAIRAWEARLTDVQRAQLNSI